MNIKPKLVGTISILVIIAIVSTSFFSFQYMEQMVINSQQIEMRQELDREINQINILHAKASEDILFALKNPRFVEYFELEETKAGNVYKEGVLQFTERQRELKSELDEWIYHFQHKFSVDEACLIDSTGQEHTRLVLKEIMPDDELSPEENDTSFFKPSFEKNVGEVHVQEPYISSDTNRLVFAYTSPIVSDSGEKSAFYHFEMPFSIFQDLVNPSVGRAFVVDSSGGFVSDSLPYVSNSNYDEISTPDLKEIVLEMTSGKKGIGTYLDNGEIHYVVYDSLPTFGWSIAYDVPYSLLLAGDITLDSLRNTLIMISGIVIVGGIVASIVISNRISGPLIKLKNATEQVSKGNFGINTKINQNDEIGKLSNSFQNMAELLEESQKEKENVAAMITHDLKQPLIPISGNAELLGDPKMGNLNELQKESVADIQLNAAHLGNMIENLLTSFKIGAKSLKFDIEKLSSEEILENIIENQIHIMKLKDIKYFHTLKDDFTISGDRRKVVEVLTNLVLNAVDFVPDQDSSIEIGVKDDGKFVQFFVKDNGIGIPKDEQAKIFEKYFQGKTSQTRQFGGTGLGLAICYELVTRMKGKIWVESEEGEGTTVFFTIPKAD